MLKYVLLIFILSIICLFFMLKRDDYEGFSNAHDKIPRIIIQTWKDESPPQKYYKDIDSLRKMNPNFIFLYFTDKSVDKFVKDYYPQYYDIYNRLPIKIQKFDFFRYIAVYHYGGFYFDLDMTGVAPLNELCKYDAVFPQDLTITPMKCELNMERHKENCKKNRKFLVGQYAFGASKGNPFIKELIDNIAKNIDKLVEQKNDSLLYVYQSTGPDYVTKIYYNSKNKDKVHILRHDKDQWFGKYAVHNHYGTWK